MRVCVCGVGGGRRRGGREKDVVKKHAEEIKIIGGGGKRGGGGLFIHKWAMVSRYEGSESSKVSLCRCKLLY